jgi:hypothetical protein
MNNQRDERGCHGRDYQDISVSAIFTPKPACLSIGGANQPASLNISIFSGCRKIFHAHLQGLTSV